MTPGIILFCFLNTEFAPLYMSNDFFRNQRYLTTYESVYFTGFCLPCRLALVLTPIVCDSAAHHSHQMFQKLGENNEECRTELKHEVYLVQVKLQANLYIFIKRLAFVIMQV